MNSSRKMWTILIGLFEIKSFISGALVIHGFADCEASKSQSRLVPLTLTIGKSFVHSGTMLSTIGALILQNCGTRCYSKNRSKGFIDEEI
jgi:hypothetical protein